MLLEKVIEAQVEWGGEHVLKLCNLQSLRGNVVKALFEHIHYLEDPQYQKHQIDGYDPEDIRVGDGPQTSKFNTEVRRCIDAFEHWLRPHIDPKWKLVDKVKK